MGPTPPPEVSEKATRLRFVLWVAALTPVALALWWLLAVDYLIAPFVYVTRWIALGLFSDWLVAVRPVGATWGSWEAVTTLSPQGAPQTLISVVIPVERMSLGLPVFWALQLPSAASQRGLKLAAGTGIQLLVMSVLLIMYLHSTLAFYVNPASDALQGVPVLALPWQPFSYTLGSLEAWLAERIVPIVAPFLTWLAFNPRMLSLSAPAPAVAETPPEEQPAEERLSATKEQTGHRPKKRARKRRRR